MNRRIHPQFVRFSIWVIGGVFLLLLSIVVFGNVHGLEFAPDTFARRYYSYFELPIAHVQVWPVSHTPQTSPLQRLLQNKKYMTYSSPPKRWDLVASYRGSSLFTLGPAEVLRRYVDAVDADDKPYWLTWTKDHPKLARIFWPEIADLAQQQHYSLMPDLFDAASCAKDPVLLRSELNRILSEKYESLANLQIKLERYDVAEGLYNKVLEYEPTRAASLTGRAACRKRLEGMKTKRTDGH